MPEQLDIYDPSMAHIGVAERDMAHRLGLWHRSFHCWIVSSDHGGSLLFQRRAPNKEFHPNTLDVSAAGHLAAGETPEDGLREIQEELGITVDFERLVSLGWHVEATDLLGKNGPLLNREFQALYLLRDDRPITDYAPDPSEVFGVYHVPLAAIMQLFGGSVDHLDEIPGLCFDAALERFVPDRIRIQRASFYPRIQQVYLTIAIMAERLLEGRFPLAVA